jgi:hypothetical protein
MARIAAMVAAGASVKVLTAIPPPTPPTPRGLLGAARLRAELSIRMIMPAELLIPSAIEMLAMNWDDEI